MFVINTKTISHGGFKIVIKLDSAIRPRRRSLAEPRQLRFVVDDADESLERLEALVAGFAEFLRRPALDLLPIVLT